MFVEQKTIFDLFSNKKTDFLIPDYQRPYAWEKDSECQRLWDDILTFAFPDGNPDNFDTNSEWFLGPIVVFTNAEKGKLEVIDGQQRLTTLMLLLRAFYAKYESANIQGERARVTSESIGKCIWKTDEFGKPDKTKLKINSEVALEDDIETFETILKTGKIGSKKHNKYAENYTFFQSKIDDFLKDSIEYFSFFPIRILSNCILLPIESESQKSALRIFSTLNDRGKPLSDADIFKAQFYKFYSSHGKKSSFIEGWKDLEELCSNVFHPASGSPMDELFTRYMYYERANMGIKNSSTEALRKFYERNDYELLKNVATFDNLVSLAAFWKDVSIQSEDRFSERVRRRLFVLNYAPNSMWTYFVSVYFMKNKNADGILDDAPFFQFLNRITAFIWAYSVTNPGVNTLRTPIFSEMVNVVNGKTVTFSEYRLDSNLVRNQLEHYEFSNRRPITKSMLVWWAFDDENQSLIPLESPLEIEHIVSKKRQEKQRIFKDNHFLESLGNKSILEKRINIQASDYRFSDKVQYYLGFPNNVPKKKREPTQVYELLAMAHSRQDFVQQDVKDRRNRMINRFIDYLRENDLIK